MKSTIRITALLLILQLGACGGEDKETATDAKTKMLTETPWGHATVTHSDGDLSNQYTNFVIVFTKQSSGDFDGTFLISNGEYAFSETAGHWMFNDDFTQIIFDSGKEIDFELTADHLKLDFIVPPTGGRVTGLNGHFVFDLQPM